MLAKLSRNAEVDVMRRVVAAAASEQFCVCNRTVAHMLHPAHAMTAMSTIGAPSLIIGLLRLVSVSFV